MIKNVSNNPNKNKRQTKKLSFLNSIYILAGHTV